MRRIDVNEIRPGEVFWECESGWNDRYIALGFPVNSENGWKLEAINDQGEVEHFYQADGHSAYGPKLYTYPEYIGKEDPPEIYYADSKDKKTCWCWLIVGDVMSIGHGENKNAAHLDMATGEKQLISHPSHSYTVRMPNAESQDLHIPILVIRALCDHLRIPPPDETLLNA